MDASGQPYTTQANYILGNPPGRSKIALTDNDWIHIMTGVAKQFGPKLVHYTFPRRSLWGKVQSYPIALQDRIIAESDPDIDETFFELNNPAWSQTGFNKVGLDQELGHYIRLTTLVITMGGKLGWLTETKVLEKPIQYPVEDSYPNTHAFENLVIRLQHFSDHIFDTVVTRKDAGCAMISTMGKFLKVTVEASRLAYERDSRDLYQITDIKSRLQSRGCVV